MVASTVLIQFIENAIHIKLKLGQFKTNLKVNWKQLLPF